AYSAVCAAASCVGAVYASCACPPGKRRLNPSHAPTDDLAVLRLALDANGPVTTFHQAAGLIHKTSTRDVRLSPFRFSPACAAAPNSTRFQLRYHSSYSGEA